MIIGWIGLTLLVASYGLLIGKNTAKYFIPLDTIASALLTLHAFLIFDMPFMIVNGFITLVLAYKWNKRELEVQ